LANLDKRLRLVEQTLVAGCDEKMLPIETCALKFGL